MYLVCTQYSEQCMLLVYPVLRILRLFCTSIRFASSMMILTQDHPRTGHRAIDSVLPPTIQHRRGEPTEYEKETNMVVIVL